MTSPPDNTEVDPTDEDERAGTGVPDRGTGALDDRPEADVLDQSIPVEDEQVPHRPGSRDEASDADVAEQSIEVPLDEDQDRR
jgi:hypothetical protein